MSAVHAETAFALLGPQTRRNSLQVAGLNVSGEFSLITVATNRNHALANGVCGWCQGPDHSAAGQYVLGVAAVQGHQRSGKLRLEVSDLKVSAAAVAGG